MDLVLAAPDTKLELERELARCGPCREIRPGLYETEVASVSPTRWPQLVFARQLLPDARLVEASSIRAWSEMLAEAVIGTLPDDEPWSLHVFPFQPVLETTRTGARAWHSQTRSRDRHPRAEQVPAKGAGSNRCRLIREALTAVLQKRRRYLLRQLRSEAGAFDIRESLVQLLLLSPEQGLLSVTRAPHPFEQRHVVSCFPAGYVAPAADKAPPSRAFAKLIEAELRMGTAIKAPEQCVDLGASPGSWTYVAAKRGARVLAVDRSELRADVMRMAQVRFEKADAFAFQPPRRVDWLICDVIAAAQRSADLLRHWLEHGWCRRFVVTLKLDDAASRDVLDDLERDLSRLAKTHWLLRLCANKKEVCAFGQAASDD